MNIRETRLEDAEGIVTIIKETVLATHKKVYSPRDIQNILDNYSLTKVVHFIKSYDYFVAEEEEKIIGCVLAKEGKMRSLYVLPSFQGKGLGKKLVETSEDCIKKNGYKEIWLWSSLVSYDFYSHMGYEYMEDVKNDNGIVIDKAMKKIR